MKKKIIVLDQAEEELFEAEDWYESQKEGLGPAFRSAIDEAMGLLVENPVPATAAMPSDSPTELRRVFVKRFPFSVVFMERGDELWILAFAHHRRRPGYWRDRLK